MTAPKRHPSAEARPRGLPAALLALAALVAASGADGQSIEEFALPSAGQAVSSPAGITAGPDGALWFAESAGNRIGRITPSGSITEYQLSAPAGPDHITAGPDGNLWFTEQSAGRIGRITTTGGVTEFELPPPAGFASLELLGIVAGPDGQIWFTERRNPSSGHPVGVIGRMTTTGALTELPLPPDHLPGAIAAGSDGALWFTQSGSGSGKIGRMTTSGSFTEFGVTSTGEVAMGIALGPDGNLWFTDPVIVRPAPRPSRIGRIDTSGAITEFDVPTAGSFPTSIAAGPDGNLWFTDSGSLGNFNWIGRITTDGVVAEFPLPSLFGAAFAIAAGPDGNLWFTEPLVDQIGRITTSGAACVPSPTNLCLHNARFRVQATWATPDGATGPGRAVTMSPDAGYFWFFSPDNPEVAVKALDGCSINGRSWFFASGLTDVWVVLTVTDTLTGQVKTYLNEQQVLYQPNLDTDAFSCP